MDNDKFADVDEMREFAKSMGPNAERKCDVLLTSRDATVEAATAAIREVVTKNADFTDAAIVGALEAVLQLTGKLTGIVVANKLTHCDDMDEILERTMEGIKAYAIEAIKVTRGRGKEAFASINL